MVQRLDNEQYNDKELIEIKLVLNLPYINNSDYSRIDGEIELNGIHYNYVKRKVQNDTLYLLCLPNKNKTKLYEEQSRYTERFADVPSGGKENNSTTKKTQPLTEYSLSAILYTFNKPAQHLKQVEFQFLTNLTRPFIDNSFKPPEPSFT